MDAFELLVWGSSLFSLGWLLYNQYCFLKDQAEIVSLLYVSKSRSEAHERATQSKLTALADEIHQMKAAYDCEEADISDIKAQLTALLEQQERMYRHIATLQGDGMAFQHTLDKMDESLHAMNITELSMQRDVNEVLGEVSDLRTRFESLMSLMAEIKHHPQAPQAPNGIEIDPEPSSALKGLEPYPEEPSEPIIQPKAKKRPSGGIKWGKGLKQ